MITKELADYIRDSLKNGQTKEQIKSNLMQQGSWKESDLEEAFSPDSFERKISRKILLTPIFQILILAFSFYFGFGLCGYGGDSTASTCYLSLYLDFFSIVIVFYLTARSVYLYTQLPHKTKYFIYLLVSFSIPVLLTLWYFSIK